MKRSLKINLEIIRELAKMSKNVDELIEFIKMEVELLEHMKADGVILLPAFEEIEWVSYYLCTTKSEISEEYDFVEYTYDNVTDEYIEHVIDLIHEKLDKDFSEEDWSLIKDKKIEGLFDGLGKLIK